MMRLRLTPQPGIPILHCLHEAFRIAIKLDIVVFFNTGDDYIYYVHPDGLNYYITPSGEVHDMTDLPRKTKSFFSRFKQLFQ